MKNRIRNFEIRVKLAAGRLWEKGMEKEPGIDGILVTVGLCIVALLLCIVMKDSMTTLVTTIVKSLTREAEDILTGVRTGVTP